MKKLWDCRLGIRKNCCVGLETVFWAVKLLPKWWGRRGGALKLHAR